MAIQHEKVTIESKVNLASEFCLLRAINAYLPILTDVLALEWVIIFCPHATLQAECQDGEQEYSMPLFVSFHLPVQLLNRN